MQNTENLVVSATTGNTTQRNSNSHKYPLFSMGKLWKLATFMAFFLLVTPLYASWNTFGNCSAWNLAVNTTVYVDNNRAKVTNYIAFGADKRIVATSNEFGTFAIGQRVLVMDMYITNCSTNGRNYDLGIITAVYPNLVHIDLPSSTASHVATGTKSLTQIIVIPQYENLALNAGGKLTCNPFDGNSGGIIAFNVCSTLTFNGGIIDGEAKGAPANVGGIGGGPAVIGGASSVGVGGQAIIGNGFSASYNVPYFYQGLPGVFLKADCDEIETKGGDGGCGEGHYYGDGPNPGGLQYLLCKADKSKLILTIGNAGQGGTGGQGAGAGGAGGGGGAGFYNGLSGNLGDEPQTGYGFGGNGGNGGAGGAAIYVKAYNIVRSSGTICVISKGGDGDIGESKLYLDDAGGTGGLGGNGGFGDCDGNGNMIPPGGGGAPGVSGNGADGGGGGNGGQGGPVWIGAFTVSGFTASNVDASGGAGRNGGLGSASGDMKFSMGADIWKNFYGQDGLPAPLCSTECGSSCPNAEYTKANPQFAKYATQVCNFAICSCDDVFRILSTMTKNGNATEAVGKYWWSPISGNPANYVKVVGNALYAYEFPEGSGSCSSAGDINDIPKIYVCPELNPGEIFGCSLSFWSDIAQGPPGTWIPSPTSTADWGQYGKYENGSIIIDNITECEFGCVNGTGIGDLPMDHAPRDGYTGSTGITGLSGGMEITLGEPVVDFSDDPAEPFTTRIATTDAVISNLKVFPNPAQNELNLEYDFNGASQSFTISITDMTGKVVQLNTITPGSGMNTIKLDIRKLSPGTYIVSFKNEKLNTINRFNIVKQ